ncbi:hypothetical protein PGTUg99_021938 [Puccinia graminis f. sp. tritici]|uniref:Uncharacterized protein n=2 Tax=Puccinia graminis f. sp. tritici TaxID=56615 RepID=E3K5B8_PUCGT|nr:uncharacterized protein PGTG_06035 [Puccinia graminis f. sp. tritici CRL 75-36-700-3]EFP79714.1 hypothetical protein PGTG_06035 [Puccinia graminis f. sp. tritici CRL 75-36-700-3]KAA1105261.1 hypothetical protein PGTUg99_021938 [Puccinia graminis f. sp. tritici]
MSSSQSHFPGGNPPVGVENVNRAYSTILPNSNSSLSRCISAFVRVLLDIEYNAKKSPSNTWMKTPSAHDFHVGSNLPESIILRPIDCIPPGSLLSTSERIAPVFRSIFIHDLSISDFPGVTFAWDHPWDSPWNQIFAKFVLKHWRNGYTSGAFAPFFMNPVEAVNTILQLGILHRWFLGRQKGVRLGQFSHEIKAKKSKSEKKSKIRIQISQHRRETLLKLNVTAETAALFDNIKSTSDTEQIPPRDLLKIPLPWRSEEFCSFAQKLDDIFIDKQSSNKGSRFVHEFVLESRRKTPTSARPAGFKDVPRHLPSNCYAAEYVATLSESQRNLLNPKGAVDLLEIMNIR